MNGHGLQSDHLNIGKNIISFQK